MNYQQVTHLCGLHSFRLIQFSVCVNSIQIHYLLQVGYFARSLAISYHFYISASADVGFISPSTLLANLTFPSGASVNSTECVALVTNDDALLEQTMESFPATITSVSLGMIIDSRSVATVIVVDNEGEHKVYGRHFEFSWH